MAYSQERKELTLNFIKELSPKAKNSSFINASSKYLMLSNLKENDRLIFCITNFNGKNNFVVGRPRALVYEFITHSEPLIEIEEENGDGYAINSFWVSGIIYGEEASPKVKSYYEPMLPLQKIYFDSCPIYKVLFNKYGHNSQWKNTLYDIDNIDEQIKKLGLYIPKFIKKDSPFKLSKKLKQTILRLASKNKISRDTFNKTYSVLSNSLLDHIYLDEDY